MSQRRKKVSKLVAKSQVSVQPPPRGSVVHPSTAINSRLTARYYRVRPCVPSCGAWFVERSLARGNPDTYLLTLRREDRLGERRGKPTDGVHPPRIRADAPRPARSNDIAARIMPARVHCTRQKRRHVGKHHTLHRFSIFF